MFKKTRGLLLNKLSYHITENSANSIKPFVCGADVVETVVVKQYFLYDEDGHGFAKLRASFHNAKAERYDLRCQEEVDDFGGVVLDKSSDDTKRGQP
jgi:hypothetical protein